MSSHLFQTVLLHVSSLFLLAVLGWDLVQSEIPAVDFIHKYEHVFAFKCVLIPLISDA